MVGPSRGGRSRSGGGTGPAPEWILVCPMTPRWYQPPLPRATTCCRRPGSAWRAAAPCEGLAPAGTEVQRGAAPSLGKPYTYSLIRGASVSPMRTSTTRLMVRRGAYWSVLPGGFCSYGHGGDWLKPAN
jgi:hypothetical protein